MFVPYCRKKNPPRRRAGDSTIDSASNKKLPRLGNEGRGGGRSFSIGRVFKGSDAVGKQDVDHRLVFTNSGHAPVSHASRRWPKKLQPGNQTRCAIV